MQNIPNKSLGQHWLHDAAALQAVCDGADVTASDTVLEIGPGLGPLTARLLEQGARVIAVEFDNELAASLRQRLIDDYPNVRSSVDGKLEIIQADILTFDLTRLPRNFKVAANIPYYLTSKLLRILNESSNPPAVMSLLVQKEVAERVCAPPGSMSLLSVSAQLYNECSLSMVVPAALFTPAPKVDSQIVVLKRRAQPLFVEFDEKKFFSVVKAGFSQRRKKLRSSLSGGLQIEKPAADALLQRAGLSADARAQELSLEQWYALSQAV